MVVSPNVKGERGNTIYLVSIRRIGPGGTLAVIVEKRTYCECRGCYGGKDEKKTFTTSIQSHPRPEREGRRRVDSLSRKHGTNLSQQEPL